MNFNAESMTKQIALSLLGLALLAATAQAAPSLDDAIKLIDQFGRLHRFGFGMFRPLSDDTGAKMARQKFQSQGVQGRSNGRYLVENIDAVPFFVDHAPNPCC